MVKGSANRKHKALENVFEHFRNNVLNIDPVIFAENNLTIDGKPFRLNSNGYKPFADIYRYIGLKSIEPNAKPIVMVKGRQVGATTMAAALECYFMACNLYGNHGRPPIRLAHLFPTLSMAAAYTKTKLDPMISSSKPVPGVLRSDGTLKSYVETYKDTSSPANDNLHFKQFIGGNQIFIESTGLDGDRIRGRTLECALFDEIQDIPQIAIGAVTKVLAQAQYGYIGRGIQVYFGTPKRKGSAYWNMWQMSQQNYYHLHCEACDDYFPLYRPDVDWEKIWLYGYVVKCSHCGHEQDKRKAADRGRWIPVGGPENEDYKYIGYHINQLYIPRFTKETIVEQKPENNPINTERIYQNEVLGEFFDGEGGTISPEEIQEKCGDINRRFALQISPSDNRRVYGGFDWGQRGDLNQLVGRQRGQSYSCGVILTAESPQLFAIEFATRLQRTDIQAKEDVVDEMFRRYSVHLAVGDIGDAYDLTHILQKKYDERFLASRANQQVNGHIKLRRDIFPKEIIFERDYYISELMGLLKNGNIKFPYGSYEQVRWLVSHCCSMDIKVTVNRQGDPIRHYVKGSSPNDGFMALLNAYIAYKCDITNGFTIKSPHWMNYDVTKEKDRIPAVIGYCPRMR